MDMPAVMVAAAIATGWSWVGSASGAFAAWLPRAPSKAVIAMLLGYAGGVMIAASLLSLLPQAFQLAAADGRGGALGVLAGFAAGVALIWMLDLVVPHQHPGAPGPDHGASLSRGTGILIVLALTLHNIPEGMAVGVAAAAGSLGAATATIIWAVALHNVVEGMLVAVPLRLAGFRPWSAFLIAQAAGAAELVAGMGAALAVAQIEPLLPFGLALAAGAMIYLVFEELLPEAQRASAGNAGSLGATLGVVTVIVLGVVLAQ